MIIDLVVGCRPNFVKASALVHAAKLYPDVHLRLIHTGQHEGEMSDPFFAELELPKPAWSMLTYRPLSTAIRLGDMIAGTGTFWTGNPKPDFAVVVGDTDSTLAGALAAKKSGIPVAHVEAGLRCGEEKMQEEINRKMIDSVSDVLYTTTDRASYNLEHEGHSRRNIVLVGNVMVDTLKRYMTPALNRYTRPFGDKEYALLTLHRAENVDSSASAFKITEAIREISKNIPVLFPQHPRQFTMPYTEGLHTVIPMGYFEFISAMYRATFVMTDSGGVQEETTALGVPCVTIRPNTERPETVTQGSNNIAGVETEGIILAARKARYQAFDMTRFGLKPPLWDGLSAERIIRDLRERICPTL
jgi:UDP-N-acetylglucosamine 2-epimerase (non-hydrolysing)